MDTPTTPPGWYPDANNSSLERYWDGSTWTPATRPLTTAGTEPTIPLPVQGFGAPAQHPTTPPTAPTGGPPNPKPKHRLRNGILGGLAAIVVLSVIANLTSHDKTTNASNTTTPPATPTATAPTTAKVQNGKRLPNLVGKGLQYADNQVQNAGFQETPHDASGRGRTPIVYENWVVCFQRPQAGIVPANSAVNLGVVKTGEPCPSTDQSLNAPGPAGSTMPNFVGKSASQAEDALPNASITWNDVSGQGRVLIIASNWHICSQSPRAGAPYSGVPVTFGVVKYGESCP